MDTPNKTKLFPLKLPKDFHGPLKASKLKQRIREIREEKMRGSSVKMDIQQKDISLSAWKKRRSDHQTNDIFNTYIQHPARISKENPQQFKSTLHYYRRSMHRYPSRERSNLTIFGQKKSSVDFNTAKFNLSSCKFYDNKPISLTWTTPNMMNSSKIPNINNSTINSSSIHYLRPKELKITEKIGGSHPNFIIKPPTVLKIGHSSFVDSYDIK